MGSNAAFYSALGRLPSTIRWHISEANTIVGDGFGKLKGLTFNPVTALAYYYTGETYATNKRDTQRAGRSIGLTNQFVQNVYGATQATQNRGNVQVVRGRLCSALGV